MEISLATGIPCIHEVLTVQTEKQAQQRCIDPGSNRGIEAAHAALEIAEALASIQSPGSRRQTG
jgi:6,7-dimethyl-8-ribityllumazine synthase